MRNALRIIALIFMALPALMLFMAGSEMGVAACHLEHHRDCGVFSIDRYVNYHRE